MGAVSMCGSAAWTWVSGLPRSGGGAPQTYALAGGRPRSLAADGNRVFVLNHAALLALPVY
ncbi:hypothetical protein [Streptomyces roseochromogenus]|uniref:hypothetical protein n=1 Tax=Streptomyces roseochromogenus TaxID=285450 RepID=UPI00131A1C6B|nr:hypothetical protein [Streptomyces roseochromogenus]